METKQFIDQMGRTVDLVQPLRRIVSLVPSQSELLIHLGLEEQVVGVTKFCIHPAGMKERVRQIGGTKTVKIEEVLALKPDIVIGNKEENLQSDIEALEHHVPVWMSDIHDLESALEMVQQIGLLTEKVQVTLPMIQTIRQEFNELKQFTSSNNLLKTLYLIWRKPFMAAGKGTFIDDCLQHCGLVNCIEETRYPAINLEDLNPELILLSSEPYPFQEKHIVEIQQRFPLAKIRLVDGEYFSWYGSRMLDAPKYFRSLFEEIHSHK